MSEFQEKVGERQGQRTKRFLEFLRDLPLPNADWNEQLKRWIPRAEAQ